MSSSYSILPVNQEHIPVKYLPLILENKYTLDEVREIMAVLYLPIAECRMKLPTLKHFQSLPGGYVDAITSNQYGIQALKDGLITAEQLALMKNKQYLYNLFADEIGLDALSTGTITPEAAADLPNAEYLANILWDVSAIQLLKKNFITLAQVKKQPTIEHVRFLFRTENGKRVLREKIMTPEEAADLSLKYLESLLKTEWSVQALRDKVITIEEALTHHTEFLDIVFENKWAVQALKDKLYTLRALSKINEYYLKMLLNVGANGERGYRILKEKIATLQQITSLPTEHHLGALLHSDSNIEMLDEGHVTLDEIAKIKGPRYKIDANDPPTIRDQINELMLKKIESIYKLA